VPWPTSRRRSSRSSAGQGVQVDASCEALVGRIVIDGMKAARKAVTPSISGLLLK
jgi:hypothetical protein